jgi:hypothetical protein
VLPLQGGYVARQGPLAAGQSVVLRSRRFNQRARRDRFSLHCHSSVVLIWAVAGNERSGGPGLSL